MLSPSFHTRRTRESVLTELEKEYGFQNLRAKEIKVTLPKTEKKVEIVVFPFGEHLTSLLTDPIAIKEKNLLVDLTDPFKKPELGGTNQCFEDIDTGDAYKKAHHKYCNDTKDLLAPVILFVDKSHNDTKGKITLEPIMFTLGLFKRHFRNKPEAWRPLGYIPNIDHLAPRADARDKLFDYHYCVNVIISEMRAYQQLGGIDWELYLNREMVPCRLQIPLHFIIGDTEGHDKLAGRKVDRVSGNSKQCRYCDVDHNQCGNPFFKKWKLTMREDIRQWREEADNRALRMLDLLSYRNINDAFDEVKFSDEERGIHGALPLEVLHALNLGIMERVIVCIFLMKRVKQKKNKSTAESKSKQESTAESCSDDEGGDDWVFASDEAIPDEEVVYKSPEEQEMSTRGIFSSSQCDVVDAKCKELHKQLRWQSDTTMPRTNFPTGIASLSKMTGDERSGVLLLLLLVICMDNHHNWINRNLPGRSIDRKFKKGEPGYLVWTMGDELKQNMCKGISHLLMMESFMKSESVPMKALKRIKRYVPCMIDGIIRAFPRSQGTGHSNIKTHMTNCHMCDDCHRFGSLENVNSGPMECNHKVSNKKPGNNTQKRWQMYAKQTGNHYHENLCINRAWLDHSEWVDPDLQPEQEDDTKNTWITVTDVAVHKGLKTGEGCKDIEGKLEAWEGSAISSEKLLELVREKILPNLPQNLPHKRAQVGIHVAAWVGGVYYHANPCYGAEKLAKQHWALVQRETMGEQVTNIGAHLLCYINVEDNPLSPIRFDEGTVIDKKGTYVLCHTLSKPLHGEGYDEVMGWEYGTLAEQNQHLVHMAQKKYYTTEVTRTDKRRRKNVTKQKKTLAFCVFPINKISAPMLGLHDPDDKIEEDTFYYFIMSRDKWATILVEEATQHRIEEKALRAAGSKNSEDGDDSSITGVTDSSDSDTDSD